MSHPIVTIEMESGAGMTGELYPELAPNRYSVIKSLRKTQIISSALQ